MSRGRDPGSRDSVGWSTAAGTFTRNSERRATAGLDRLAGDVLALIGDEEGNELRNVFGLLDTTELDVTLNTQSLGFSDSDTFL